jgi:diguanylate cyclase (GGDEF)-like protein/PAS domain S-box-containing protein
MFDFVQLLNKLSVGIVVIDLEQKIVFWNNKVKNMSNINSEQAVDSLLFELYPKFAEQKYQDIIKSTFVNGNCSFLSGATQSAFIYPKYTNNTTNISQNIYISALYKNGNIAHLMLEISDITEHENNQTKLIEEIEVLKEGFIKVKESQKESRMLANYDNLTGLYNRYAFMQRVNSIIEERDISKSKFALLFMDIDNFKIINDTFGHLYGDILLQQVANRLKKSSRGSDIICRLGGDEFVIVLNGAYEKDAITIVVEKIIYAIRKPFNIENNILDITTSIGIAVYPDDSDTLESLLQLADTAMYKAKQNGKNNFYFIS